MAPKFALIRIPAGVHFDALNLRQDPDSGQVVYDWAVLRVIIEVNEGLVLTTEAEVMEFLSEWYCSLQQQGYSHPVADVVLTPLEPNEFMCSAWPGSQRVH